MPESIGLSELIKQVKSELAQKVDLDDPVPILAVDEIELEIQVTVSKKAEGGVKIYVVELGAGVEKMNVHTVRLKMLPLLTREQRVDELKKNPDYQKVIQRQITETLKGAKRSSSSQENSK